MIRVEESIVIDRPVSAVFAFLDRPERQPEFTPSLTDSELLARRENGGSHVAYTYSMVGIDFEGELVATEYEPDEHVHWVMSGDLEGEIDWTFEAVDGGTRFTYAAGYDLPLGRFESLARPVVVRYNERELRTTLENLKTRLEHGEPTA